MLEVPKGTSSTSKLSSKFGNEIPSGSLLTPCQETLPSLRGKSFPEVSPHLVSSRREESGASIVFSPPWGGRKLQVELRSYRANLCSAEFLKELQGGEKKDFSPWGKSSPQGRLKKENI